MSLSISSINLYADQTLQHQGKLVAATGLKTVERDLTAPVARELPAGVIVDQPIRQYTNAQLDMRPVDRADAALMAVVQPQRFEQFLDTLVQDGDWRNALRPFAEQLQQNPDWLSDRNRFAAADILRSTSYFMDLGPLGR